MPRCCTGCGTAGASRPAGAHATGTPASPAGPRDHRGHRRRGHRFAHHAAQSAARQVRQPWPPAVHRPHHHSRPGGEQRGRRAARFRSARSSVDRPAVLRPGDTGRHAVEPELVVEVGVGVVRDTSGRWRDPARLHRARLGLSPGDVPRITALPRRHPSSTASTSSGWLPARLQRVCGEPAVGPGTVHGDQARPARGRVVGRRTGRRPSGGPVSARGPQVRWWRVRAGGAWLRRRRPRSSRT